MNKNELAERIASHADLSMQKASACIQAIQDAIAAELGRGGDVRITGFGTFSVSTRSARTGRNPRTGEPINLPAKRAVRFAPAKALKEAVNS